MRRSASSRRSSGPSGCDGGLRRSGGQTRLRSPAGPAPRVWAVMSAPSTLDPTGCLIGCKFCYVQGRAQSWREVAARRCRGSWADVRGRTELAKELDALPPLPIKLSPIVTDPYQPLERRYEVTRRCLQVLVDKGYAEPVIVLTRSALVLRDVELLLQLPSVWVGMSVPTLDDAIRERLEPRAASIPERLSTLAHLKEAGLRTSLWCNRAPRLSPGAGAALAGGGVGDPRYPPWGLRRQPPLSTPAAPRDSAAWQQRQLEDTVAALAERGWRCGVVRSRH